MSQIKCGCVYDERERRFTHYCREHAVMILKKRATKFRARVAEADALAEREGKAK